MSLTEFTTMLAQQEKQPRLYGDIVFATRHGSRLYGFQTESSDEDWFVVTTSHRPRPEHVVKGTLDLVQIGLQTFLDYASSGSHQSVEALFSPQKLWGDEQYRSYIEGMRITDEAAFRKYRRTIKAFSFGDFKRRRHAVRLANNLSDLRRYGRFNPELTQREAAFAGTLAENLAGHALAGILLSEF